MITVADGWDGPSRRQPPLGRQGTDDPVGTASLLGHRSPEATQHHAKITPNTLAGAYNDARYFVRTIEVLIDRDAVTSGATAVGAQIAPICVACTGSDHICEAAPNGGSSASDASMISNGA